MTDDDWVTAALDDDCLVGKILVTLSSLPPPPPPPPPTAPPSGWSVRQRRSRSQTATATALPSSTKKPPVTTRASPTTPLSWSGATSVSVGTIDGAEESSKPTPNPCEISRSKVMLTTESTPTKRPRKKKTLADLKEDEMLLLKERKHLKRQIATLQATCEEKRTENGVLKKMKLDMQSHQEGKRPEAVSSPSTVAATASEAIHVVNNSSETKMELVNKQEDKFVLPDLNIPVEEDIS